jgi:hypothetical protein
VGGDVLEESAERRPDSVGPGAVFAFVGVLDPTAGALDRGVEQGEEGGFPVGEVLVEGRVADLGRRTICSIVVS